MVKTFFKSKKVALLEDKIADLEKKVRGYDSYVTTWGSLDMKDRFSPRWGQMSYSQLHQVYIHTPIVRAIIDGICRIMANMKWEVCPIDPDAKGLGVQIERATNLFKNPNSNNESFGTIIHKLTKDLLIYDAGVIEKAKNNTGGLLELWNRDGSSFLVQPDKHGRILKYEQVIQGKYQDNKVIAFKPEDLMYMMLDPDTSTPYGSPKIECLVNEVTSLLHGSQFICELLTKGQIPPGILSLGSMGHTAVQRIKKQWEADAGKRKSQQVRMVYDVGAVRPEWIAMERDPADIRMTELMQNIFEVVYKVFGISPTAMGESGNVNRATAIVQRLITESTLIDALVNRLQEYFYDEVMKLHFSPKLQLKLTQKRDPDNQFDLKRITVGVDNGWMTRNQARRILGMKPIEPELGDVFTVRLGKTIRKFDDVLKESAEPPEENPFNSFKPNKEIKTEKNIINVSKSMHVADTLNDKYVDLWKRAKKRFMSDALHEYRESGVINKTLSKTTAHLFGKMRHLAEDRLRDAFDDGIASARKMYKNVRLDRKSTDSEYQRELNKHIEKMRVFLFEGNPEKPDTNRSFKNTMRKKVAKGAIKKQEILDDRDVEEELNETYEQFKENRLLKYAAIAWGFSHLGWLWVLKSQKAEKWVDWRNSPGDTCEDCIEMADNSPYRVQDLKIVPGSGDTLCKNYCKCYLVVV